jgi:hypothetical protein
MIRAIEAAIEKASAILNDLTTGFRVVSEGLLKLFFET